MVNVNDSRAKRGAASVRVGLALLIGLGAWVAPARAQYIPFQEDPIRYYVDNPEDPVAKLQERIDRGEKRLRFEAANGYLRSVPRGAGRAAVVAGPRVFAEQPPVPQGVAEDAAGPLLQRRRVCGLDQRG